MFEPSSSWLGIINDVSFETISTTATTEAPAWWEAKLEYDEVEMGIHLLALDVAVDIDASVRTNEVIGFNCSASSISTSSSSSVSVSKYNVSVE